MYCVGVQRIDDELLEFRAPVYLERPSVGECEKCEDFDAGREEHAEVHDSVLAIRTRLGGI